MNEVFAANFTFQYQSEGLQLYIDECAVEHRYNQENIAVKLFIIGLDRIGWDGVRNVLDNNVDFLWSLSLFKKVSLSVSRGQ